MPTLGVIVNPIAGLGGPAGLKGTDAPGSAALAASRGVAPRAPPRALEVLRLVRASLGDAIAVLAAAGDMGETVARQAGWAPATVPGGSAGETGPEDTRRAALALQERGVDLILFAGGDGTARDLQAAIGERLPVVGVPAGVKMHSAVHATTPRAAAELVIRFFRDRLPVRPVEVMDVDEEAYRAGGVSARLYGYLSAPFHRDLVQGVKAGRVNSDEAALAAIAEEVAERMAPGRLYVVGPGTTTRALFARLGLPKTLLGVDLVEEGRLLQADADEAALLRATAGRPATVIVTPIGGQGHVLGRGNQQIGAALLRRLGRDSLLVIATPQKLASLQGRPLRVDTGDAALDQALAGHIRVVTGYRTEAVCPVVA